MKILRPIQEWFAIVLRAVSLGQVPKLMLAICAHNFLSFYVVFVLGLRAYSYSYMQAAGVAVLCIGASFLVALLPIWLHLNRDKLRLFNEHSRYDEALQSRFPHVATGLAYLLAIGWMLAVYKDIWRHWLEGS